MRPDDLPAAEKLRLVKEAAGLSEEELGAFVGHGPASRLTQTSERGMMSDCAALPGHGQAAPALAARRQRFGLPEESSLRLAPPGVVFPHEGRSGVDRRKNGTSARRLR